MTSESRSKFLKLQKQSKLPNHIFNAIFFIHENYTDDISLESISTHLNLNKCYLAQIFKINTSLTVTQYINKIRLEKSKDYLSNSPLSILEIALNLGYNNVTYYNRLFKSAYGISPSAYRKLAIK